MKFWNGKQGLYDDFVNLKQACWNMHYIIANIVGQQHHNNLDHEEILIFAIITIEHCYLQAKRKGLKDFADLFKRLERKIAEENDKRAFADERPTFSRDVWRSFTYTSLCSAESFCTNLEIKRRHYFNLISDKDGYDYYIDEFIYLALFSPNNAIIRERLKQKLMPVILGNIKGYIYRFTKLPNVEATKKNIV